MGSLACRSYAQRDVGRTIGELRLRQRQYTVAIRLAKLQNPCNQMTSYLTHNLLLCFSRACSRRAAQWCTTVPARERYATDWSEGECHCCAVGLSQLKGAVQRAGQQACSKDAQGDATLIGEHISVENCEREAQTQILDEHTKT